MKRAVLVFAVSLLLIVSLPLFSHAGKGGHRGGRYHGGHRYGYWHGPRVYVGPMFYRPWYYPPPVYYGPVYAPPPVVYVPPAAPPPAYAYPDPALTDQYRSPASSDPTADAMEWITVPGQWVDGTWVDEHRVQVPKAQ
ncbi:MAG: hypothetical protein A4E57_00716 [Syntrophorhabdaceae bacterium PtaU1.Bin034]|nr:MAG: hypothetical protein A4E57_00716 [Syntrophorhabdaceae bacterium PtaU1.Bin034]